MESSTEFEISQGELIKYHGSEPYVTIPDGVEKIGKRAFRDCRELRQVTLPESLLEIEEEAFLLCVNLTRIHGGSHVIFIGKDVLARTAWYQFYSENETDWKEDFLFIGKVLVKARRNLRKAIIPEGTTMIAADAFYERVLLREVKIPSSVKYLGWRAFKGCSGLTAISIPESVKTIGWHCFEGCSRWLLYSWMRELRCWKMVFFPAAGA